ncbi:hypothetical protein M1N52_01215 [Thermodesulfovibrionales bacterium]|nr:hypothetical protein [Thermodesulfovibrionales bacterium]MCL0085890.1 hypothetical protein [Thermodesulfovibrionales bacterium]
MAGINKNSPWEELQGQALLGRDNFIEESKNLLATKEEIKEIPKEQRYAGRPRLSEIFKEGQTKS